MKKNQTIKLFGQKIPMWQDCKRCGAKLAVRFVGVTYNQPCNKCRNSKEWQEEQEAHKKERSYEDIFATHKPTAVFEYKGRNIYTNHKGDIIRDEAYRPLKTGR